MRPQDSAFYDQINYILQQYRDGKIDNIPDVMKLIEMVYGDYLEFYPDELPQRDLK